MSQRFTTPVKRERDDYVPHSGTQSHMSQRFITPIRRERDDYVPPFGRLTPGLSMMPGPDDNTEYHARSPWPQTPSRASSARYSRDSTLNPAATPYSQSPTPFYGTYSGQAPCNFSPVQDETPAPQTPPRALRQDGRSRKRRRDEEEEEACEQPAYDSSKEALPDLPAYHPRLPLLKTTASNLVAELARYLRPYRYSSADLVNMVQKAEEATNPPEQKKFLFMLLGVTGVGKSSTINSFLDEPHAAKAASTGESCTCVPTFFTHRLPHQTKLYAVEVHFLDDATRRSFLLEWIRFFCHFYFENDGSWSEEEHQQKSAQADAALKIFRALFCDKWDFQSPAHIRACLQRYRENVDMLLQQMMQWCGALFENYDLAGDNPCLQVEKDDCEELEKSIHPHVFEDSDFEVPSRWPLVEHIRKGISTSDKLQHVDLLDLPGTADANCVRSNIAQKFIKQCDALLVVTDARRAIACDAVDRVSRRWGERFEDGLAVIVTNTDSQINSALAAEMDRKKECLGNYKELAARIEQLDKEKTAISTKIKKIRGDREQKMALLDKKEELTEKLRDLRDQQFDGLVDVRNSFIARKLQDDKSKYLKTGNKLKVFCVSNTHYQSLNKEKSSDDRQMNAQTTGIPKLRRHALEMAAPRVFREADAFINKAMTVLRGASLWVEATPTRRHEELMAVVKRPALELVNDIDEYLVRLQGSHSASTGGLIGDKLLQPLEICREDSVAAAIGVKHSIDKWNPATIRAFFNNNGKHQTARIPYQIWNERFTEYQTNNVVDPAWLQMHAEQEVALANVVEFVKIQLQRIPDELNLLPSAVPLPQMRIKALLDAYCVRITAAYESRVGQMNKKLSNIKLDASKDVCSAYFTSSMRPMYECAKLESGNGCTNRMRNLLEHKLTKQPSRSQLSVDSENPFDAVRDGLDVDLTATATWVAHKVKSDIKSILREMESSFDGFLQKQAESHDERNARRALGPFLAGAMRQVEAITAELEQIKGGERM